MNKYPLVGANIIVVILFVLCSLNNVIGYQSVQSSNQQMINNEVNQKGLLFQTIADIANNNEIQRIILKSQISREGFLNPDTRFPVFTHQVLTKNQLKHVYLIGLMLSKTICKSSLHSMVEQYQLINPKMQQEIKDVIEKDTTLKEEITQLSNSECDCEEDNSTWHFPILCTLLFPLAVLSQALVNTGIPGILFLIGLTIMIPVVFIGYALHCWWL
jgi:hypothetical protein